MRTPIFANKEHEIIIDNYIMVMKQFVREISNENRWNNFLEVYDIIIEYHNNYGKGVREQNYWDWIMILPINLSVMVNGYLAGIETKRNATAVKSYKIILNELLQDVIDKIEKLEPIDE